MMLSRTRYRDDKVHFRMVLVDILAVCQALTNNRPGLRIIHPQEV